MNAPHSPNSGYGFTLVELLIVVAIIAIISVIGGINIKSRMQVANLEQAAQQLVADVSYARSAAILKGCPTRLILCATRNCEGGKDQTLNANTTTGVIEDNSLGVTARYYSILRMFQKKDETDLCWDNDDVGPMNTVDVADDGYIWWDHDRRPQQIGSGVGFKAIYKGATDDVLSFADGSVTTGKENATVIQTEAFYFDEEEGRPRGVVAGNTLEGDQILFQLQLDTCEPLSDEDCPAFFVTIDTGGDVKFQRCVAGEGSRSDNTNGCF